MGFRFRRSVRIMPGVRLNLSKSGISTSLGGRGATLNIGRRGTRATVGIPGTGLSYSTRLSGAARHRPAEVMTDADAPAAAQGSPLLGWLTLGGVLLALGMCVSGRSSAPAAPETPAQPAAGPATQVRSVAAENVNCRAEPETGAVIARLHKGETVAVIEAAPRWTKLVHPGGDCWVSNALLSAD
jgi:hypothetical protein